MSDSEEVIYIRTTQAQTSSSLEKKKKKERREDDRLHRTIKHHRHHRHKDHGGHRGRKKDRKKSRERSEESRRQRSEQRRNTSRRSTESEEDKMDHDRGKRRMEEDEAVEEKSETTTESVGDPVEIFEIDTTGGLHRDEQSRAFSNDEICNLAIEASQRRDHIVHPLKMLALAPERNLVLKPVTPSGDPAELTASRPLGAAYDPVPRFFYYTDTGIGKIVVCTYEGRVIGHAEGFKLPSAIAIITAGECFGVLDYDGLTVIDLVHNKKTRIASGFEGRFRGLARTSDGNLVSINTRPRDGWKPRLVVFSSSTEHMNEVLCSIDNWPYDLYPNWPTRYSSRLPSFLSVSDDVIFVTDLDQNAISSFDYFPALKELRTGYSRSFSELDRFNQLTMKYVSGIIVDSNHSLMVADASGRAFYLLASNGSLLQKVPLMDNSYPYVSGFSISPEGRVLVCCRAENKVRFFDLVPMCSPIDALAVGMSRVGK